MTTLEQARRRALALGAELEVDGRRINAGRQRLTVVPKPPQAPEPPPAPPAPPPRDPLRDLIAMQAAVAHQQAETLGKVLADITGRLEPKIIEKTVQAPRLQPIVIRVVRNASGKVVSLDPSYGDVGDGLMADLREVKDERGLLTEIRPVYN